MVVESLWPSYAGDYATVVTAVLWLRTPETEDYLVGKEQRGGEGEGGGAGGRGEKRIREGERG